MIVFNVNCSITGQCKQSLKPHRSHEEIPRRRQSHHLETKDDDARYHSAPSFIDEVWHTVTFCNIYSLNLENDAGSSSFLYMTFIMKQNFTRLSVVQV